MTRVGLIVVALLNTIAWGIEGLMHTTDADVAILCGSFWSILLCWSIRTLVRDRIRSRVLLVRRYDRGSRT